MRLFIAALLVAISYAQTEPRWSTGWMVDERKSCRGESLKRWADGSDANGSISGIENCKAECDSHPECSGFTQIDRHNKCSFWKGGVVSISPARGHHCYRKLRAESDSMQSKIQKAVASFQVIGTTNNDGIMMLAIFGALTTMYYGFKGVQKMMLA